MNEIELTFGGGVGHNLAKGGDTAAVIVSEYADSIAPIPNASFAGKQGLFFLLCGTNDLTGGGMASIIWNDIRTVLTNAQNAGYQTIAFRVPPSLAIVGQKEVERINLNGFLEGGSSFYSLLINIETELFPDPADTQWYYDGTHFTNAATFAIGNWVATRLWTLGLLPL